MSAAEKRTEAKRVTRVARKAPAKSKKVAVPKKAAARSSIDGSFRLTARVSDDEHQLIEKAAALKGFKTVNAFVVSNMLELSQSIVDEFERTTLAQQEVIQLLDALDRPARDLPKLKRLFS